MTESFDDLQQLAGEYVLGTLSIEARRQIEQRLPKEALLREAIERWEQRLLPLTALAQEQQPSAGLWPRIARDLQAASKPAAGWRRWWSDLTVLRGLSTSGFALAASLALVLVVRPAPSPAYMVVLVAPKEQTPGWVVQASMNSQITLTPLGTFSVPDHKALQFWTKAKDWNAPVSLGLVQPDKSLKLMLNSLPPLQAEQLFEITLEPSNGSLTGKPSGPVLYVGKAVRVSL